MRARGWRVLVIDKAEFPRDKTCAGWVTPAVLEMLRIDPEEYARGRVLQPIHAFRIGLMGRPPRENHHGATPVSYGIRRCEFDHWLLERSRRRHRARREGARAGPRGRPVDRQRRLPRPLAGRRRRPLLPGGGTPRRGPGQPRARRHRQGSRVRDDARAAGTLRGARRHAGAVVLQGPQGLRLDLPQGRVPQHRPGARGQPASRRTPRRVRRRHAGGRPHPRRSCPRATRATPISCTATPAARSPVPAACWSATPPGWPTPRAARASAPRSSPL
jgi:hypothetical protein